VKTQSEAGICQQTPKLTRHQLGVLATVEAGQDPYAGLLPSQRSQQAKSLNCLLRYGMIAQSPNCPGALAITEPAAKALDAQLPRCANCGHREVHCLASGCNHVEGDDWCDCIQFVDPNKILDANAGDGGGMEKARALSDGAKAPPRGAPGPTLEGGAA